jgi:tetratricopeptide (TPR) repeat protein
MGLLRTSIALGILCCCTVMTSAAYAQGAQQAAPSANKSRAEELFNKSAETYRQGDFKQTIELLDEAYALDPQPVLLYNRARAQEGLGNVDEAISGYERFLAEDPNAPDRGAIEQRLATLRRQRDERVALEKERDARREPQATQPPTSAPPAALAASPPRNIAPYALVGGGAAGLAVGTIVGFTALSRKHDAAAEPVQQKSMDLKDKADGLATVSTVSFVIGGVLLAAGVTWWLVDHRSSSPQRAGLRIRPSLGLSGVGAAFP